MNKVLLFGIILISILFSCKIRKQKKSLISRVQTEKLETEELITMVGERNVVPDYLSIKSKGVFKDGQSQQSFTMHIRIRKDSLIWVSVTALGLEAARVLLKQDSILLIDRLNKRYFKYDYGFLADLIKMPVNMKQVESLLCGNLLFSSREYRYHLDEDKKWQLLHTDTYQEERVEINDILKPVNRTWSQLADIRSLESAYENHESFKTFLLPQTAVYKMQSGNRVSVLTLNHSQIDVERIEQYPFSIPLSYKKGH